MRCICYAHKTTMKMARQKYTYDPNTLIYTPVKITLKQKLKRASLFVALSLIVGLVGYSITAVYYRTPKEKIQASVIRDYKDNVKLLEGRVEEAHDKLGELIAFDDSLYRTMLGANVLSDEIRNAGTGGTDKYEDLALNNDLKEITNAFIALDQLVAQMKVQEKSYSSLFNKASVNVDRMKHLPAIIPVANWDLKRIGSGFSPRRFHPILNYWREHKGIDFVASRGTEIYTSGDGIVESVRVSSSFGKVVVVNHGYGIKTLYAHMNDFACKRRDVVKRGQLIGYVGNTGLSDGPHLHYEVHVNNKAVDPVDYFFNDLSAQEYKDVVAQSESITTCME